MPRRIPKSLKLKTSGRPRAKIKSISAVQTPTARVYATVQNPFVITKYDGIDPEISGEGIDNNIYPRPRVFMIGLNLNF